MLSSPNLGTGLPARTTRIGVAHRLCLWHDQDRVDVRSVIDRFATGSGPLDPADPVARRLPSDSTLSVEGDEAVLASPPVPIGPGVPEQIDDLLRDERTGLRDNASAYGVTGVSGSATCLSISVPDESVVGVGLTFVESCLLALATVVEPATSPGLLVRPRRGRLEIGGGYVEGSDLVAGLTLLAACIRGLLDGGFPPRNGTPDVVPSRELYGWFAPARTQPDDDAALAAVWTWARPWARAQGLDPGPVDELVSGSRALRRHTAADPAHCSWGTQTSGDRPRRAGRRELPNGLHADPEWLTWHHAVWLIRDAGGHECHAVVPLDQEDSFLAQLDAGRLDVALDRMLHRRTPRRRLTAHAEIDEAVLWHDVHPAALVPVERHLDGSLPRVSRRQARRANLQDNPTDGR